MTIPGGVLSLRTGIFGALRPSESQDRGLTALGSLFNTSSCLPCVPPGARSAAGATLFTTDGDFDHLIPDHLAGVVIDPKVAAASEN